MYGESIEAPHVVWVLTPHNLRRPLKLWSWQPYTTHDLNGNHTIYKHDEVGDGWLLIHQHSWILSHCSSEQTSAPFCCKPCYKLQTRAACPYFLRWTSRSWNWGLVIHSSCQNSSTNQIFNDHFRNQNWRYLPFFMPKFQGTSLKCPLKSSLCGKSRGDGLAWSRGARIHGAQDPPFGVTSAG